MATTKIWALKNRVKERISYIINPEKTTNKDYNEMHALDYFEGTRSKEEKRCFVTAINCDEYGTYEVMKDTKDIHRNNGGILAYHGYQSFKPNEVTPEIAHEIGVKLVAEVFENKYEVIVATHQDKNHIHNHFIVNSVSYTDGKKYNNNKASYARLRNISDSLCEEYGLSVVKEWQRYTNRYQNAIKDNEYYNIVKEDIDNAISDTIIRKQFLERLRMYGYNCYIRNDKLTVYKEGQEKVRIERVFGKEYSLESIDKRLADYVQRPFKKVSYYEIYNNFFNKNNKNKGIYGLYLHYCYLLKVFPTEYPKQRLSYSIRKDIVKMDRISEEARFLATNKIETYEELKDFKENSSNENSELKSKRANLWKKHKRVKTQEEKDEIIDEITSLSERIKDLNNYNKYCNGIEERSKIMQSNIQEFAESNLNKTRNSELNR